jgi:ubiquitin fusion degradation protein 1
MLFKLIAGSRETHCGVLEFTAEEGCCYIPYWMMQNLLIEEGTLITVKNVSLPKATFVKLQPQSVDFLEISNPRAVLEHALRNFSCVTIGDVIQIQYNSKNYHFELKAVEPSPAACIIETDCNVDFDAPLGYVEPSRSSCPSPETATTVSTSQPMEDEVITGTRIVDGCIVRGDDPAPQKLSLADRTGATGVQKNAAIPEAAPEVDYWALAAGDGSRLDGKKPAVLKDAAGNEVDVRKIRAEAAARRMQESALAQRAGTTVSGEKVEPSAAPPPVVVRKNKRVGGKYSQLKANAFQGSANQFHSK